MSGADAAEHLRLWLRAGLTGCEYAKRLAGKANGVAIESHVGPELPRTSWLDNAFDANADADRAVIAAFPRLTSEGDLVNLLNTLARDRWRVRRRLKSSPTGAVLIGLDWTTKNGDVSETMGFAPFPSMPVPRRAPYVAIATWPGGRSNPFRGQGSTPPARQGIVSFLDAPPGVDELAEYERRWKQTNEQVTSLMSMPPDDATLYRRAAFVISPAAATGVTFDP